MIYGLPQSDDPSQKNTLLILKFLPFMIGWFSLSVPSGLSIYWYVHQSLLLLHTRSWVHNPFPAHWILQSNYQSNPRLFCIDSMFSIRLTNNVLSTAQQVWLRKMGGAKPVVSEGGSGIITAGRAKRSNAQPAGERCLWTSFWCLNLFCLGYNFHIQSHKQV